MINHTVTVIALVANGRFKQPNKWLQLVNAAASIDAEQSTAADSAASPSAMSDARRRHEELHAQAEHVRAS